MKTFNITLKTFMVVFCLFCLKFTLASPSEDLFHGIYRGNIDMVNQALKQGANPDFKDSGSIALLEATKRDYYPYDIVNALLSAEKANPIKTLSILVL